MYIPNLEAKINKTVVLPIKSDPTSEDGDGDGLLDAKERSIHGKVVVPRDYEPLKHNGPENIDQFWQKQIDMENSYDYQTDYGDETQLEKNFEKFFKFINFGEHKKGWWSFLCGVNKLDVMYPDKSDFLVKLVADAKLTQLISNTEFGTEWGAAFLRFRRSKDGKTLHARPDRDYKQWQYYLGYFDLYDSVFQRGTNALRKKIYYKYNGETYILWCWKGDYMNLGLGSEFGIYKIVENDSYELINGIRPIIPRLESILQK